jgi:hypothetical protein
MARKISKNMLLFGVLLVVVILGATFGKNVMEGLTKKRPSYYLSCDEATSYGKQACLSAVIRNARGLKCSWNKTGRLINGNQPQYSCQTNF